MAGELDCPDAGDAGQMFAIGLLEIDCRSRQVSLDLHDFKTAPCGTAQPVTYLGFAVEDLKVPDGLWPEFKARTTPAYRAPSYAIARDLASGMVADHEAELPSATGFSWMTSRPASSTCACR